MPHGSFKHPGGEGGIRTPDRLLTYTRFPGVRLKPLIHLSGKPRILPEGFQWSSIFRKKASPIQNPNKTVKQKMPWPHAERSRGKTSAQSCRGGIVNKDRRRYTGLSWRLLPARRARMPCPSKQNIASSITALTTPIHHTMLTAPPCAASSPPPNAAFAGCKTR